MESVVVAYSGGVDSSVLLAVAREQLGSAAVAFTASSASLPANEAASAARVAAGIGAEQVVAASGELAIPAYTANRGDRCFHCKSELYQLAEAERARRDLRWVADGTIVDDLAEHRPGLAAARAAGVRHPLVEAGFTKAMVRLAAEALGLPNHDKPAAPCLASRFAVGTPVSVGRLGRVERAEGALRAMGLRVVRVRVADVDGAETARVELGPDDLAMVASSQKMEAVLAACSAEGFRWTTIDPRGYRRGSVALPSNSSALVTGPSR